MTVRELIAMLQKHEPDRIVVLQKDGEGNGYSPCAGAYTGSYGADSSYSGEVGLEVLTPALRKQGYAEEDVIEGEKCIVLYPVN